MEGEERYCRSCYRAIPEDRDTCSACAERSSPMRALSRVPLAIGAIGIPLLIVGVLGLNPRLCYAGAIISGCAVLAHALLVLRSGV